VAGGTGKLAVIRQVRIGLLWRQAIQSLVSQNGQLKIKNMSHWQPVKLPRDARDVLTPSTRRVAAAAFYTA